MTVLRAILKWILSGPEYRSLYQEWKEAAKRMGTDGVK
jgi:hypothetical protein